MSIKYHNGCVLFKSRSIYINLDLSDEIDPVQSGEKERADLSVRSGHGHLVLVCAERRRPVATPNFNGAWQAGSTDGRDLVRFFSDVSEQIWI